jgi:outer membrane protein assembly complex protein YaeT
MIRALMGALLILVPSAASAQAPRDTVRPLEERGCCLDQVPDEADVGSFDIDGNQALDEATIKNALFTDGPGFLSFLPWADKPRFDKQEFLNDLRRIHILYQRHGYFSAELESYRVERDNGDLRVMMQVREGEPTRVDSLGVEGLETIDGEELRAELIDVMPLKQGEVFSEADLRASRDTLEAAFQNRGYAFATVLLEYRIRKELRSATVTYSVDPGDVYYFGQVRVVGEEPGDENLIRRQLAFRRGELYDRQDVQTSQRRIYDLALYRRVDIEPQLAELRGDTVDVVVTVVESPHHAVRVGVGYGTEDLLRAQASWLDRNFFGGARQFEARASYSRIEREGALTYRQPSFLLPDLSFQGTTFLRFEIERNYTVERLGSTARWAYTLGPQTQARISTTWERDDFSEIDEGVLVPELGREFINPSKLFYVDLSLSHDTTDSLFRPSRGYRVGGGYQLAMPTLTTDYAYHKFTVLITHYRRIREGWVLAMKLLPGVILTYSGDPEAGGQGRVPLFQRLFAGGANSVRGYERRQLGPKDDPERFGQSRDPEPIGGNGLLETSVELRFPLRGKIHGAAFLDAGNVWRDAGDISPGDLKYTPGVGVRYETIVGPIRLDIARRIASDANPNLPRWVLHISIGNAF